MHDPRTVIFLIFLGLLTAATLPGQQEAHMHTPSARPLPQVIKELEKTLGATFNYDPQLLAEHSFTGHIRTSNLTGATEELLRHTPLEFTIDGQTVLIYMPPPRTFELCGRVVSREDGQPMPFATVHAPKMGTGTNTNEDGTFTWQIASYKNEPITISFLGYESQTFMVSELLSGKCPEIRLVLNRDIWANTVIVEDYLLTGITEGESYGSVNLDYKLLGNWQSNVEHDILKTAQLLPGISSFDESAVNLSIRGSSSDQNLLLWEGAKLYDPGHLFGMISAVNPFVIDEMKIHTGVFDPGYDNVVGGVIDMSLSDTLTQQLEAGIGSTFTEAHLYLQAPLIKDKLSLLFSGRNAIDGVFSTPTLTSYATKVFQDSKIEDIEEEGFPSEQALNFYDWNAKVLFRPAEPLQLSASYLRSGNNFNYWASFLEEELNTNDDVESSTSALSLAANLQMNERWDLDVSFTRSTFESNYEFLLLDIEDDILFYLSSIYNSILDQTTSLATTWKPAPQHNFRAGIEFNTKAVNFNYLERSEFEPDYDDINSGTGSFHNLFGSYRYQDDNFVLNAGLRATRYLERDAWFWSPRVNVRHALTPELKLKFSAGILHQFISQLQEFGENNLGINNRVWILNQIETHLDATQTAGKISFGVLYQKNKWLLDMDAYYHRTEGLHTYSPLFGQANPSRDFLLGGSRASGLDVLLKKNWRHYQLWASYSRSEVLFNFPDIQDQDFLATYNQRHQLNWTNNWKFGNWNLSFSYLFKTGLPFSRPEGFSPFEYEDETYYEIEFVDLNREQLPNYHRFDLGVTYRQAFPKSKINLEAAFSVINLFARQNAFSRDYFLDYDEEEDPGPQLLFVDKFLLGRTPQVLFRVYY